MERKAHVESLWIKRKQEKPLKMELRSLPNLSKSSENRIKIVSRSLPERFEVWESVSPTWMAPQERSKRAPRAPKSAQERPQSVPNPSQMEPKTLPKPIVKGFFALYFPIPNLHRFFVDVYVIFILFLKARTFKFIAPVEAKRYFLQDRSFEQHTQKSSKNRPQTHSKST